MAVSLRHWDKLCWYKEAVYFSSKFSAIDHFEYADTNWSLIDNMPTTATLRPDPVALKILRDLN